MEIKVRTSLDVKKPVNMKMLTPKDKLLAGFLTQWQQTKFYKSAERKREEAAYMEQLKQDELVKSYILAYVYSELTQNTKMQEHNCESEYVTLAIDNKYVDSLKRILPQAFQLEGENHKDFLSFNVTRIPEQPDIRKAYPNMKLLLSFSKKAL